MNQVDFDSLVAQSTNSWDAAMAIAPFFGLTKADAADQLYQYWHTSTKTAEATDFTLLRGDQK